MKVVVPPSRFVRVVAALSLVLTALLGASCSAGVPLEEEEEEPSEVAELELEGSIDTSGGDCMKPSDEPGPSFSLFGEACVAAGGAFTCKSEDSGCCSFCDEKGCSDMCLDRKEVEEAAKAAASAPSDDGKSDEVGEPDKDGSTARQSDDPTPGEVCGAFCRWVRDKCRILPIPDMWCYYIAIGCIDICMPHAVGLSP